ncbi:MAG: MBL fold metallo-hydrolase, partial [Limisphaerales bacterium]
GLKTIAVKHQIPIYCNRLTRESIEKQFQHPAEFQIFNTGTAFDIGDVHVETFSIPHDAYDPVGFLIHTNGGKLGFLTDLGHATRMIVERVRCANVLVLEANYDRKLLQEDTRRPWSTKQRIMSRHGHLSNDGAANVIQQVATENLKHLYLCHLSKDCNDPKLAHRTISDRLEQIDAAHVQVETTTQVKPSPTLEMKFGEPAPAPAPAPASEPIAETDSDHPQLALF